MIFSYGEVLKYRIKMLHMAIPFGGAHNLWIVERYRFAPHFVRL